jgi:DNA-binding NtrC family response regulator
MKDFPHASFSPDLVEAMQQALEGAVDTLPHPVNSDHVQSIAENILRGAEEGERDPATLQRMALVEFQIRSDER